MFQWANTQPASERLYDAEMAASNDQHRAYQNANTPNAYRSNIYAPGTEFVLCQAVAQLMSAVVGVLNESITEAIKSFYKLRKAFMALESILNMEERFIHGLGPGGKSRIGSGLSELSAKSEGVIPGLTGKSRVTTGLSSKSEGDKTIPGSSSDDDATATFTPDPDSDVFGSEIDAFIHSGMNCCFGILLLLISMVPPSFSKLLSIVGFRGDKQRGLRMLWQAARFPNVTGAISALTLLGYYNAFVRYCDITADVEGEEERDVEGYPQERLISLLAEMRKRYPKSRLWILEECRMNAANRKLDTALDILLHVDRSPLKQIEALRVFELSLDSMYLHEYEICAQAFIEVCNCLLRVLY